MNEAMLNSPSLALVTFLFTMGWFLILSLIGLSIYFRWGDDIGHAVDWIFDQIARAFHVWQSICRKGKS